MSDQALPHPVFATLTHPVRVVFRPYDHADVQDLLAQVQRDFGLPGDRWRFRSPDLGDPDPAEDQNSWQVIFWFRDSQDAVVFALKYDLRKYAR